MRSVWRRYPAGDAHSWAALCPAIVAATLVRGTALPVGVVTGALGAPFLVYLLVSANRVGRGG